MGIIYETRQIACPSSDSTGIIAATKRDEKVKTAVIEKTDTITLEGFVAANVKSGSTVFTDEHNGYAHFLPSMRSSDGEAFRWRVREGRAHANGFESFWSMLRRGHKGTYHRMRAKHFTRYVGESAGRHNVHELDTTAQMAALARGLESRRLRYDDLVASDA